MPDFNFSIGDIVEGQVTGIQNYGVFVQIAAGQQGLVHISECRHGYIENVHDLVKVGDKVRVMVIDVDEYTGKVSLSIRTLIETNTPKYPYRGRKHKRKRLPNIGFKSLERALPQWIENGLDLAETDPFNINNN